MSLFSALGNHASLLLFVLVLSTMLSGYRARGDAFCSASVGVVAGVMAGFFGSIFGNVFFASLVGALGGIVPSLRTKSATEWGIGGILAGALAGSITGTLAIRFGPWSPIMLEWLFFCFLLFVVEVFFRAVVRKIGQ